MSDESYDVACNHERDTDADESKQRPEARSRGLHARRNGREQISRGCASEEIHIPVFFDWRVKTTFRMRPRFRPDPPPRLDVSGGSRRNYSSKLSLSPNSFILLTILPRCSAVYSSSYGSVRVARVARERPIEYLTKSPTFIAI